MRLGFRPLDLFHTNYSKNWATAGLSGIRVDYLSWRLPSVGGEAEVASETEKYASLRMSYGFQFEVEL